MTNTMTYRGYTASMTFDPEDKIIVGRVLDIDDIIAFHGESVGEFETNFHSAIESYIAACEQLGSAPEKPASGKLMLRIAPAIHAGALKAAALSGTSLNKWAEHVLSKAINRGAATEASSRKVAAKPVPPKKTATKRSRLVRTD